MMYLNSNILNLLLLLKDCTTVNNNMEKMVGERKGRAKGGIPMPTEINHGK